MTVVTKKIFAQLKPDAGILSTLYTVPNNCHAKGTIYISSQHNYIYNRDRVFVQLIPASFMVDNVVIQPSEESNYIIKNTECYGTVPIYLQQICLNQGDIIKVTSTNGSCSFTYVGDLYINP